MKYSPKMGYAPELIDKARRYSSAFDAVQEALELVTSYVDRLRSALYLDIEDKALEAIE